MKNPYDIAIVAMGGVFPGAPDINALWTMITESRTAAGRIPSDRWVAPADAMVARPLTDDKSISDTACLIQDFSFDPKGFNLPADQLRRLDPMHQIVLEAGRQALTDTVLSALDPKRVATILAAIALPTDGASELTRATLGQALENAFLETDGDKDPVLPSEDICQGAGVIGYPAALLSNAFGLGGPTLTLDAACASSLYAVHLACDALSLNRADAVVTGGVSRPDNLFTQVGFSQLRALSPSGSCRPFDHKADGLVVGEGAGILVLKRLSDALAAKDTIFGVIRAVGTSNDLRGNLLAPDSEGQLRAMHAAYAQAGWSPDSIDLIECHGAGTPMGDATELASLQTLWQDIVRPDETKSVIGSVKSNVGHLLTAAGAAGLIKTVLALSHQTLPPSHCFEKPHPDSPLADGPFRVLSQHQPWPTPLNHNRRAAVSAFGFGGINAHLLLEAIRPNPSDDQPSRNSAAESTTDTPHPDDWVSHPVEPIAVVGLATAVGDTQNLSSFHRKILAKPGPLDSLPVGRWPSQAPLAQGLVQGTFMPSLSVAANRFRIPPNELPDILSPHLIMLNTAADALADAGMTQRRHRPRMGSVIGIDFDMNATDFHLRWDAIIKADIWTGKSDALPADGIPERLAAIQSMAARPLTATRVLGSLGSMVASRLAREFGLGSHTFTVADAAAGGVKALEIAVRSLQAHDTDAMLVGAVDLPSDIRHAIRHAVLSGSHPSETSALADGATAFVLMRLSDARDAGCRIYGTVDGIGGASAASNTEDALTEAYGLSMDQALTEASISADAIGFAASHGSSRKVAAQAESRALGQALPSHVNPDVIPKFIDGAVQNQLGNAGAAGGLLGVAAALLAVYTGERPSHAIAPDGGGLPWPLDSSDARRAIAAVMTNDGGVMHTILSNGDAPAALPTETDSPATQPAPPDYVRAIAAPRYASVDLKHVAPQTDNPKSTPNAQPAATMPAPSADTTTGNPAQPTGHAPPKPQQPTPSGVQDRLSDIMTQVRQQSASTAQTHQAYLDLNSQLTRQLADGIKTEAEIRAQLALEGTSALQNMSQEIQMPDNPVLPKPAPNPSSDGQKATNDPIFDRNQCLEFAVGSAGAVLGPAFADIDALPARVRLPGEPLMFVDRIIRIEGEPDSLSGGRIITEHDVRSDAWYLDGGRAPVSVAVEAGQADLFLCAWLGIDHRVKGTRNYRLLDAQVEFHRKLPIPGETIRYDIRIDRFIRQGETFLFFFQFTGTIQDQPLITMTNGCAGFFTPEEVAKSGGIILSPAEREPLPGILPDGWKPMVPISASERYDDAQIDALRLGDAEACFGPDFSGRTPAPGLRLPGGQLHLIDRVQSIDPDGGRYGLGRIEAVADVSPDAWFLTCHFVDDMTMPGTLMYECCAQTLRVYMQRIGWFTDDAVAGYEPILGVHSRLKCRGPVTPSTRSVVYAVDIREIRLTPEPAIIADAHMMADGHYIVMFQSIAMRLKGVSADRLSDYWATGIAAPSVQPPLPTSADLVPIGDGESSSPTGIAGTASPAQTEPKPMKSPDKSRDAIPAKTKPDVAAADQAASPPPPTASTQANGLIFTREQVLTFARGKPSDAFGAPYLPFDGSRFIARLPAPPYSFLDRIIAADAEPWNLAPTGWVTGEFDVLPDHWYFAADRTGTMPFGVLLEVALQSCGWLAAYLGSALHSRHDMKFRNLGGTATLHRQPLDRKHTLTVRAKLTRISKVVDMIVERFKFEVFDDQGPVYEGETEFGFFTLAALASQVGIRGADDRRWESMSAESPALMAERLPVDAPVDPEDPQRSPTAGMAMPSGALMMIDVIDGYYPLGGSNHLGFVRALKTIKPKDWYFPAHFYKDPVCPGSLGIEAFIQTLKWTARRMWPEKIDTHQFKVASGTPHKWTYRGQILPHNQTTTVEADIVRIDNTETHGLYADGFLLVDNLPIYEMTGFGIELVPTDGGAA